MLGRARSRPRIVSEREVDLGAEWAAAQAWWREAGVDLAFADTPRDWLAQAHAVPQAAPAAPATPAKPLRREPAAAARIGGDRAGWPAMLAGFADWWLSEPSLGAGGAPRVPPQGPANAGLMVLVPMPEADDRQQLLAGPQGRLLEAMLTAFGFPRADTYLASALPRYTPAPEWDSLAAGGLAELIAHHVALAAPQRLLVLGRDVSPLLGHDPAQAAPFSPVFNHDGGSIPLAVMSSLEALLERPGLKRTAWARWLEWTGTR